MKLSDCIAELERRKKQHGDLDVMRFLIHDTHSMSDHFALHNGKRATQKQWLNELKEKEAKTVAIVLEDSDEYFARRKTGKAKK